MFIGEYQHSIDDKGRVMLPKKFQAELMEGAVVTRGLDACLFLYSKKEWEKLATRIAALGIAKSGSRAFSRHMLAGAMDVELDKQGRVVLPEYLRSYANVKKDVVIAGLYSRLELWDKAAWNKYKAASEKESSEVAEQLGELGV